MRTGFSCAELSLYLAGRHVAGRDRIGDVEGLLAVTDGEGVVEALNQFGIRQHIKRLNDRVAGILVRNAGFGGERQEAVADAGDGRAREETAAGRIEGRAEELLHINGVAVLEVVLGLGGDERDLLPLAEEQDGRVDRLRAAADDHDLFGVSAGRG